MCLLFGKKAKALKEELMLKVKECNELRSTLQTAEKTNGVQSSNLAKKAAAISNMEKELKDRIAEVAKVKSELTTAQNTIKNLQFELAKYKPNRDKKGKFVKK